MSKIAQHAHIASDQNGIDCTHNLQHHPKDPDAFRLAHYLDHLHPSFILQQGKLRLTESHQGQIANTSWSLGNRNQAIYWLRDGLASVEDQIQTLKETVNQISLFLR